MRKVRKIVAIIFSMVLCMSMVPSVSLAAANDEVTTEVALESVDAGTELNAEIVEHDCSIESVGRSGAVSCRHTNPIVDQLSTYRQYLRTENYYCDYHSRIDPFDWYRCIICGCEDKFERVGIND